MFEIGSFINGGVDKLFKAPVVKTTFSNPLITSIVATIVIFLIFSFIIDENDAFTTKGGIVLFAVISTSIFMHAKYIRDEHEIAYSNRGVGSMLNNIMEGGNSHEYVSMVSPEDFFGATKIDNDKIL